MANKVAKVAFFVIFFLRFLFFATDPKKRNMERVSLKGEEGLLFEHLDQFCHICIILFGLQITKSPLQTGHF